jgi:hypothetical protein
MDREGEDGVPGQVSAQEAGSVHCLLQAGPGAHRSGTILYGQKVKKVCLARCQVKKLARYIASCRLAQELTSQVLYYVDG